MIWGIALEPEKYYTTTFTEVVHLSLATLESRNLTGSQANPYCHVILKTSQCEQLLCTLVHGLLFQHNLDIKLMPKEKVTFSVQGTSVVYITGYSTIVPEEDISEGFNFESRSRTNAIQDHDHHNKSADEGSEESEQNHQNLDSSFHNQDFLREGQEGTDAMTPRDIDMETGGVSLSSMRNISNQSLPGSSKPESTKNLKEAVEVLITNLKEESFESQQTGSDIRESKLNSDTEDPSNEMPSDVGAPAVTTVTSKIPSKELRRLLTSGKSNLRKNSSLKARYLQGKMSPSVDTNQVENTTSVVSKIWDSSSQIQPSKVSPLGRRTLAKKSVQTVQRSSSNQQSEEPMDQSGELAKITSNDVFKCRYCNKSFRQKAHCDIHERIHSAFQPSKGKEDFIKSAFGTTIAKTPLGFRTVPAMARYVCHYCDKSFTRNYDRKRHERIHTGIKPYTCCYCEQAFARKEHCKRHEAKHVRASLLLVEQEKLKEVNFLKDSSSEMSEYQLSEEAFQSISDFYHTQGNSHQPSNDSSQEHLQDFHASDLGQEMPIKEESGFDIKAENSGESEGVTLEKGVLS